MSYQSYHNYKFPTCELCLGQHPRRNYDQENGIFLKALDISDLALNNTKVPENQAIMDTSQQPKLFYVIKPRFNNYNAIFPMHIHTLIQPVVTIQTFWVVR